jgi:hypothetical protein
MDLQWAEQSSINGTEDPLLKSPSVVRLWGTSIIMPSFSSYILASAGASLVNAQFGNFGSPFPNTTYPGFESENPYTVEGSSSFQWSPPKYPSPWGEGSGDWKESYVKARAMVAQLTLEERVNLTSGVGTSEYSLDQWLATCW